MKSKSALKIKRTLRHMTPGHVVKSRVTRGTIERFADKIGLVFFGYVDQKDDDHRLVRGHTVSSTHIDKNYCVGTIRGYDVTLVSRNDVVLSRDMRHETRCHWLIATIDLKAPYDVPHVYIGHESRKLVYYSSFEQLTPLALSSLGTYPKEFTKSYTVYGKPTHALEIEALFVPEITRVIASHFKHTSIEVEDNCIFLYVESEHPSEALLEKVVSNGLWLAEALDIRARQLKEYIEKL